MAPARNQDKTVGQNLVHRRDIVGLDGRLIFGVQRDDTQAECVRIPHADGSLHPFPPGCDDENPLVMLSDNLPTGYECGVLNGEIHGGDPVTIVGAGPIGLSVLLSAALHSPGAIFTVDPDAGRLEVAQTIGATHTLAPPDHPPVCASGHHARLRRVRPCGPREIPEGHPERLSPGPGAGKICAVDGKTRADGFYRSGIVKPDRPPR